LERRIYGARRIQEFGDQFIGGPCHNISNKTEGSVSC